MRALLPAPTRQFAVISVRTGRHFEQLVLAYPDEKTLRDLVAEPSIVALGYGSREEAEAGSCCYTTTAQPLRQKPMRALGANSGQAPTKFVRDCQSAKDKFRLAGTRSLICSLLQQAFAAAVVLLYSKNLVSAAIRAVISS
jgi:hypothetical protein